jgi:hypothetical protein
MSIKARRNPPNGINALIPDDLFNESSSQPCITEHAVRMDDLNQPGLNQVTGYPCSGLPSLSVAPLENVFSPRCSLRASAPVPGDPQERLTVQRF